MKSGRRNNRNTILTIITDLILFMMICYNLLFLMTINLNASMIIEPEPTVIYNIPKATGPNLPIHVTIYSNPNLVAELDTSVDVQKVDTVKTEVETVETNAITTNMINSVRNLSYTEISEYTDLGYMKTITVDDMNNILDYWHGVRGYNKEFPFKNHGQTFIDAARLSGLDPVYIMAHAALESGWGTSKIARDKHNYFGIGAYDNSAYASSSHMGDNLYSGIVGGAQWIARNYYNIGQNTLYSMRYNNGKHEYCTSNTWHINITKIIRNSYKLIQN